MTMEYVLTVDAFPDDSELDPDELAQHIEAFLRQRHGPVEVVLERCPLVEQFAVRAVGVRRGDRPGAGARLVRDEQQWPYTGFHGFSFRRLRVWEEQPGRLVAVITEAGGQGTSVTNAAASIRRRLEGEYPDHHVTIIEHYPPDSLSGEHFDQVRAGRPGEGCADVWTRLDATELGERLPGLFDQQAGPTDEAVVSAWRTIVDRGLIRVEWRGLEPVVHVDADLLRIVMAAGRSDDAAGPAGPANP